MRRRTLHATFAAVALGCAGVAAYEALRLEQATRVNESIAEATAVVRGNASSVPSAVRLPNAGVAGPDNQSSLPEAQFARAFALAHSGQPETALKLYKELAQGKRADLRVTALFNIGNLHMREAQRQGAEDPTQFLPLIELAKQSYRDVLHTRPDDWDTRYNLERALQLAPELDDPMAEDEEQEAPEEHVSSTLQGAKMDLP